MQDKVSLRRHFREQRKNIKSLPESEYENLCIRLAENLEHVLQNESGTWALYSAYGEEADPGRVAKLRPYIKWAYPKVSGDSLEFYLPNSSESFTENEVGIYEPVPEESEQVALEDIRGFIIPGLAFDQEGVRIGQGRGFYDRVLSRSSGKKIGVAWSVQISEEALPREEHDIFMDIIVTEKSVWTARAEA